MDLNNLSSTLAQNVSRGEKGMQQLIGGFQGKDPSTIDLLNVQREMSMLQLSTQLQSTMMKSLSDMLKEIVQKAS
jgi:type III secretion protein F